MSYKVAIIFFSNLIQHATRLLTQVRLGYDVDETGILLSVLSRIQAIDFDLSA